MGADIHMYVEYKNKKEKTWNTFIEDLSPFRNYDIFGFLTDGNVRSMETVKSSVPLRGLPDDVSTSTKEGCEDKEMHSISWITYKEFKSILKESKKKTHVGVDYKAVLASMKSLKKDGMKVRLVFCFDS